MWQLSVSKESVGKKVETDCVVVASVAVVSLSVFQKVETPSFSNFEFETLILRVPCHASLPELIVRRNERRKKNPSESKTH